MCHETLFHLCVPATEKVLRTVLVYIFIVIGFRLAGKRELAQFKSFDLIVLITIANAVQNAIIGPDNTLTGGFIGAATLLATNNALVRLTYRYPRLNTLLAGGETVMFENGRINFKALRREMVTEGELRTIARRQGAHDLNDVERIALEPNGNVEVVIKEDRSHMMLLTEIRKLLRALEERG